MKSVKVILAALFVSSILFVSCSPSSVADEDKLYDTHSPDVNQIKVQEHG